MARSRRRSRPRRRLKRPPSRAGREWRPSRPQPGRSRQPSRRPKLLSRPLSRLRNRRAGPPIHPGGRATGAGERRAGRGRSPRGRRLQLPRPRMRQRRPPRRRPRRPAAGAEQAAEEALTDAQTAALTGWQCQRRSRGHRCRQAPRRDAEGGDRCLRSVRRADTERDQRQARAALGHGRSATGRRQEDIRGRAEGRVAGLKTLAAEVTGKEGVPGATIKSALDPIMAKLEGWARQPA